MLVNQKKIWVRKNRPSLEQLTLQIPHVLAAPKDHATIETLCFRPKEGERQLTDQLQLSVRDGVVGDRWKHHTWVYLEDGSPDPQVQVSILPKRVLDLVWSDRDNEPYPGDTMIVDMDVSEANLPVGTRLQAGTAVLDVGNVFNTGCPKWYRRYGPASLRWINIRAHHKYRLRGVLCKIVQDGHVSRGDKLVVLSR